MAWSFRSYRLFEINLLFALIDTDGVGSSRDDISEMMHELLRSGVNLLRECTDILPPDPRTVAIINLINSTSL